MILLTCMYKYYKMPTSDEVYYGEAHDIVSCFVKVQYIVTGYAGLQGPYYSGTNCFHRREVIYGLSPEDVETGYQELATNWALRSVPELCYALLPPYCLITNATFFPKIFQGPWVWIPVSLFLIYNVYTLIEYKSIGQSARTWWNNQRMGRITAMSAWFLGFVSAMVKMFGISDTVFEITQKKPPGDSDCSSDNAGRFSFDESPVFVVATTILVVQLTALGMKLWRLVGALLKDESGNRELFCCAYMVVCYWPFLKGLFGKGEHRILSSTVVESATLAFFFVLFCTTTTTS